MISIICVYNNRVVLEKYLLKSLENQISHYEFIGLDNCDGHFQSAAQAFNSVAKSAKGDWLMFSHQDIIFNSPDWLKNLENMLNNIFRLGIAGVAGRGEELGRQVVTNISHGVPARPAGQKMINQFIRAQTVDECAFFIPKKIFDQFQFDERVCDDWHLYGAEYSLNIKRHGYDVYVLAVDAHHASVGAPQVNFLKVLQNLGRFPKGYYVTLEKLIEKYKKDFKCIYTTCGIWRTDVPLVIQRVIYLPLELMGS